MARRRKSTTKKVQTGIKQLPWSDISNRFGPVDLLEPEDINKIHDASMTVLETVGLEVASIEARAKFRSAGANVDEATQRVRFDRGMIETYVAKAPSTFTLHARNPAHNLKVGGRNMIFCPATTPPNCSDLDRGRRPGNYEDFCNLLKLSQHLNIVHCLTGYPVEPQDLPVKTRHLDCYDAFIRLTDKVWRPYCLQPGGMSDGFDMVCIARGIDLEQLKAEPSLITNINLNSPLKLDDTMSDGLIAMAEMGQAVVVSSFALAGAMAPITMEGALLQQNAEVLSGIALAQITNPGSPVIYGSFTSNVDMKSGSPALGTPEYMRTAIVSGQLARHYGLPYRTSNSNSANSVDAQAIYESQMSIWGAVLGGANILFQGFGWLESGLVNSFEKFMIDADMLQMVSESFKPFKLDEDTLGVHAIEDVGPGGHFFSTEHTMMRYKTAFYEPIISDWRNFETWQEAGSPDAVSKANQRYKEVLAEYQTPALDAATSEELREYVQRRKQQRG